MRNECDGIGYVLGTDGTELKSKIRQKQVVKRVVR
jgi:hypothetical protein